MLDLLAVGSKLDAAKGANGVPFTVEGLECFRDLVRSLSVNTVMGTFCSGDCEVIAVLAQTSQPNRNPQTFHSLVGRKPSRRLLQ